MCCRKLKICIVCGSWGDVSFIKPWDLIQSIQIHTERTSTMFSKSGCAALEFTGFFLLGLQQEYQVEELVQKK